MCCVRHLYILWLIAYFHTHVPVVVSCLFMMLCSNTLQKKLFFFTHTRTHTHTHTHTHTNTYTLTPALLSWCSANKAWPALWLQRRPWALSMTNRQRVMSAEMYVYSRLLLCWFEVPWYSITMYTVLVLMERMIQVNVRN